MRNKIKDNSGITLAALIITIIVMLILASVSIRVLVGDNGILNSTEDAKTETELAEMLQEVNYMLLDYNIEDADISISGFLNNKVAEGEIDKFIAYPIDDDTYGIMILVDGYYYDVGESKGSYQATFLGEDPDGYDVITKENFNEDGTLYYDLGSGESITVLFMDSITADLNFDIVSGEVTIYITEDMDLTNEGLSRSAIDVHEGATLNLYIGNGVTMTVDSGYGEEGETASAYGAIGGPGGYAGIHVPDGATLNLYGSGTLVSYGGDAGAGGGDTGSGNTGGGRRRSELEQALAATAELVVGGNTTFINWPTALSSSNPNTDGNSGYDGEDGEGCGTICIHGSLEIYAYGGAGASGGNVTSANSGAGAGGYPAAGIGRWTEPAGRRR